MRSKKQQSTLFLVAMACLSVVLLIFSIQPKAFAFDTTCNVGSDCSPWGAGADARLECRTFCNNGHGGVEYCMLEEAQCVGDSYPNCACHSVWACMCKDDEFQTYHYWEASPVQCSNIPLK